MKSDQKYKKFFLVQLFTGLLIVIYLFQYKDTSAAPDIINHIDKKISDSKDIHILENHMRSICKKLELIN